MSGTGGPGHPVVVAPLQSRFIALPEGVRLEEPAGGSPGATYPDGFVAGGVVVGLKDSGRPDMGVLAVAPEWREEAASAAVFTTNAFAAAPIVVNRKETDLGHLLAVIMSSGNANACTGEPGLLVARAMQKGCAGALDLPTANVAVGSTGIIGVQLDPDFMAAGARKAAGAVTPGGGPEFDHAIMTTDRFPKMCALEVGLPEGERTTGSLRQGRGDDLTGDGYHALRGYDRRGAHGPRDADGSRESRCRLVQPGDRRRRDEHQRHRPVPRQRGFGSPSRRGGVASPGRRARRYAPANRPDDGRRRRRGDEDHAARRSRVRRTTLRPGGSPGPSPIRRSSRPACTEAIRTGGGSSAPRARPWQGHSLPKSQLHLCGVLVVEGGAAAAVSDADRDTMAAGMKEPEIDIALDLGLGAGEPLRSSLPTWATST